MDSERSLFFWPCNLSLSLLFFFEANLVLSLVKTARCLDFSSVKHL